MVTINNKACFKKYFCCFEGYYLCLTNVRIKQLFKTNHDIHINFQVQVINKIDIDLRFGQNQVITGITKTGPKDLRMAMTARPQGH
jgi:hypothetical protein